MIKLTVDRAALLPALERATAVMSRRNSIPILDTLHLEAAAGAVTVTGTNMDQVVAVAVDCAVDGVGAACVPGAQLAAAVQSAPEGCELELVGTDDTPHDDGSPVAATLYAASARYKLQCLAAADFPLLKSVPEAEDGGGGGTVAGTPFAELLRAVAYAQSSEEQRNYLCGIFLEHSAGAGAADGANALTAVATDGHRLARAHMELGDAELKWPDDGVILPTAAQAALLTLADGAAEITLAVDEARLQASDGKTTLTTRLIDGTFPDYRRVIPAAGEFELEFAAKRLAQAAERVAFIAEAGEARGRSRIVKVTGAGGMLTLAATSDIGEGTDGFAIPDAPAFEFGVNTVYLRAALAHIASDGVRLFLADDDGPSSPIMLRPTDGNRGDDGEVHIVMPARV